MIVKSNKIKITAALTLCLVFLFGLCSCSDVIKVKSNDNGFDDPQNGIGYTLCSRAVFALKVGKVWAKDQNGNEYCEFPFENPEVFLCDNDPELPFVYRAESQPDVTINNFYPIAAFLYLEGEKSLYVDHFVAEKKYLNESAAARDDVQDDSPYTYAIRDAMTLGDPVRDTPPVQAEMETDYTVHIRLLSAEFPGLYYEIVFWRDLNGLNYLYDRGSMLSYLCPYIVTYRLWEDS